MLKSVVACDLVRRGALEPVTEHSEEPGVEAGVGIDEETGVCGGPCSDDGSGVDC